MSDSMSEQAFEALARRLAGLDAASLNALDDLLASVGRNQSGSLPVVRVRAVEVVDDAGRVRIAIGNTAGAAEQGDYFPGISLTGPDGVERVGVVVNATSAVLSFSIGGNDAVLVGADEQLPGQEVVHSGPYIEILRRLGRRASGWRITGAGFEVIHGGD